MTNFPDSNHCEAIYIIIELIYIMIKSACTMKDKAVAETLLPKFKHL